MWGFRTEQHQARTLIVVAGGNSAQIGCRLLLSPVVPLLVTDLRATKSMIGLALTAMWATYALFQFPSGALADKYGERRVLAGGLMAAALGSVLVSLAPSLPTFGLSVIILGAGAGLYFSPGTALLTRIFKSRGGPIGVFTASGAVAGVAFSSLGGFVGSTYGWRTAVGIGAVGACLALAFVLRFVPNLDPLRPTRTLRALVRPARIIDHLHRPSVEYSILIAVMFGFTYQSIASFFPTFLVDYRGLSTPTASVTFGATFILSSGAQVATGYVSDALTRDAALAMSAPVASLGLVVLLFVPGTSGVIVGTVLLGLGISWSGVLQARIMDQFVEGDRGYGFGLVRTIYMIVAASGSLVVGSLADVGGWLLGYGAIVLLLATTLVALSVNRVLSLNL